METAVSGRPDQLDDCADTPEPLRVAHLSKIWLRCFVSTFIFARLQQQLLSVRAS